MVRSRRIGSLVLAVSLGMAGLAWSQRTASRPSPAPQKRETVITVTQEGKPSQKARILKYWRLPTGYTGYLVQAVDTDELMTIVEEGPVSQHKGPDAGQFRAVATTIYRWGKGHTPPSGVPAPPPNAVSLAPMPGEAPLAPSTSGPSTASAQPAPSATASIPTQTTPTVEPRPPVQTTQKVESPTPTPSAPQGFQPTRIVSRPTAGPPTQSKTVATSPVVTAGPTVERVPGRPVQAPAATAEAAPPREVTQAAPAAPPGGVPAPGGYQAQGHYPYRRTRVVVTPKLEKDGSDVSSLLSRIFSREERKPAPEAPRVASTSVATEQKSAPEAPRAAAPSVAPEAAPVRSGPALASGKDSAAEKKEPATTAPGRVETPPPAPAAPVVKAVTTTPEPASWRESWGEVKKAPADPQYQQTSVRPPSEEPKVKQDGSAREVPDRVVRAPLPTAQKKDEDPLDNPDRYWKKPEDSMPAPTQTPAAGTNATEQGPTTSPGKDGTLPVSLPPTSPPLYSPTTPPVAAPTQPTKDAAAAEGTTQPEAPTSAGPAVPPGLGSVLAAGAPELGSKPAAAPTPPQPAAGTPAAATPTPVEANAFSGGNAQQLPGAAPGQQTAPVGVNAFTVQAPPAGQMPPQGMANPQGMLPPPGMMPPGMMPPGMMPPGMMAQMPHPGMMPQGYPMPGYPMGYPMMPMTPSAVNVPQGLNNAFTQGGTTRPIPADFGQTAVIPNAFGPEGETTAMAPSTPGMMGYPPMMGQQAGMMPYPPQAMQGYPPAMMGQYPNMMPGPLAMAQPNIQRHEAGYAPVSGGLARLRGIMEESIYPSQREWAAGELARVERQEQMAAVEILVSAARKDPAPLVRMACIRALVKLRATTLDVVTALEAVQKDKDPRVRQEAGNALEELKPGKATATDQR